MTSSNHSRPAWRTSTHSGQNGNCIQVAALSPAITVRDSKNPAGQQLEFPAPAWRTFTRRLHAAGLAPVANRPSIHGRPALTGTPDRADRA